MAEADFATRYAAQELKELTPSIWDRLMLEIDTRFIDVEEKLPPLEAAEDLLVELGLERINEILIPAFTIVNDLIDLGVLFYATSDSSVLVQTGTVEFVVDEAERERFAPAEYLSITTPSDVTVSMYGKKTSYDRDTGSLYVQITAIVGTIGTFSDWEISASPPPDVVPPGDMFTPWAISSTLTHTMTQSENDFAPTAYETAAVWRLDSDGVWNITGIVPPVNWAVIVIHNISDTNNLNLMNEDVLSAAANRFSFNDDVTLLPDTSAIIQYDTTDQRWRLLGVAGSAGGGGGASEWEVSGTPPSNPLNGTPWYDLDSGAAYLYVNDGNSNQWIAIAGGGNVFEQHQFSRAMMFSSFGGL